jgi:hypothetical protein
MFAHNPAGTLQQIITLFSANPTAALVAFAPLLLSFAVYEVVSPILLYTSLLLALAISLPVGINYFLSLAGPAAPVAVPGGAGGSATAAGSSVGFPAAGLASTAAAPVTTPASGAMVGTAAGAAPAPAPAALGYLVGGVGGPDAGPGPTWHDRPGQKAPAASIPAAAAAVPSREPARTRLRRRAALRGYGDEFADIDSDPGAAPPEPDDQQAAFTAASDRGAGGIGFAGAGVGMTQPAGLTALTGDSFGGGPTVPMVPHSWGGDVDEPGEFGADERPEIARGNEDQNRRGSTRDV